MIIAGHLGADPEVRFTSSGKKVTTLRVATNSKKGAVEETTWWRVTIWGEQMDKVLSFFKKGSTIMAFGEMQKPELFTDRDGKQQISLNLWASSIQFSPFGGKSDRPGQEGGSHESSAAPAAPNYAGGASSSFTSHGAPAFSGYGAQTAVAPKPSMPPFGQAPVQQFSSPSSGETFDDEIPF